MQRKSKLRMLKLWMVISMLINTLQHTNTVNATEDVISFTPKDLESIVNHLIYPRYEYSMHRSALRNHFKNLIASRQLAFDDEQNLENEDPYVLDKRSIASLAVQGLLRDSSLKRSLATLAKNGQFPTQDPEQIDKILSINEKRFLGSVARKAQLIYNKNNQGTLTRDFQLPKGKRILDTLDYFSTQPKRNLAAIARYNSMHMTGVSQGNNNNLDLMDGKPSSDTDEEAPEKRSNIVSPVHVIPQKQLQSENVFLPLAAFENLDYADLSFPNKYLWYPSIAGTQREQKRFLGRVLPPTRATASTNRGRT